MLHCEEISAELYDLLRRQGSLQTTVHSLYRRVINLEWEGRLLTCGAEDVGLSPYGLKVRGNIHPEEYTIGQGICISTESFSGKTDVFVLGATVTNLKLRPYGPPDSGLLSAVTRFCLEHPRKGGIGEALCQILAGLGDPPLQSFYTDWSVQRLGLFVECLDIDLDNAPNILGLGVGLTPSTDDFVLGLLSLFLFLNDKRCLSLKTYIAKHVGSTTPVSQNMLRNALEDLYPAHIIHFYNTLIGFGDISGALRGFLRHGHSSGMDTLYGILTALRLTSQLPDAVSTEESL